MKLQNKIIVATLAGMTIAAGCKKTDEKKDGSSVKSVDAIVDKDEAKRMHCGNDGEPDAQTPEGALAQVFKRVPSGFRGAFPDLKAHIEMGTVEEVKKACTDAFNSQIKELFGNDQAQKDRAEKRLNKLNACWTLTPVKDMGKHPVPTIHIVRDKSVIHENLLAMVTYAMIENYFDRVGEIYTKMEEEDRKAYIDHSEGLDGTATQEQVVKYVAKVKDLRKDVTRKVVEDLVKLGAKNPEVAKNLASYAHEFAGDKVENLVDNLQIQNLFFAESIEAYYCSTDSKKKFTVRGMTGTLEAMDAVAAYFGPVSSTSTSPTE